MRARRYDDKMLRLHRENVEVSSWGGLRACNVRDTCGQVREIKVSLEEDEVARKTQVSCTHRRSALLAPMTRPTRLIFALPASLSHTHPGLR